MKHISPTRRMTGAIPGSVRVWDPVVRIGHWTLVAAVAAAWGTGDESQGMHEAAGYVAAGVVMLRILWGFIGSRHARFSDFVRGPAAVLGYAGDMLRGRKRRYLGHNPAGGAMILAVIATVLGLGLSGWLATTDLFWGSEGLEELHELLADLLLVLVALHVGGVLLGSIRDGENLVRAMITGRKRSPGAAPG